LQAHLKATLSEAQPKLLKELAKIKPIVVEDFIMHICSLKSGSANEPFSSTHLDRKDEDEALKHNLLPYKTKKRTIAKNELCVISVRHPDRHLFILCK